MAIREDVLRTDLFGYDIRLEQLRAFVLVVVLAGVAACSTRNGATTSRHPRSACNKRLCQ